MKKILFLLLVLFSTNCVYAQQIVSYQEVPIPTSYIINEGIPDDPALKELQWHKFDTQNFIILSLDLDQGRYLYENIELIKKWVLTRWGFPNVDFTTKCKVLCLPNKELLQKLFRLNNSHGEVRKDANGKVTLNAVWMVLDGSPAEVIPSTITIICLSELQQKYNFNIPLWANRGISILNGTLPQIRYTLSTPPEVTELYFTKTLLTMNEIDYLKLNSERRQIFDRESTTLCLLLRKEFGQSKFIEFLKSNGTEQDLHRIYGFKSYAELDVSFSRYFTNLSKDIINHLTPDDYLKIKEAR